MLSELIEAKFSGQDNFNVINYLEQPELIARQSS